MLVLIGTILGDGSLGSTTSAMSVRYYLNPLTEYYYMCWVRAQMMIFGWVAPATIQMRNRAHSFECGYTNKRAFGVQQYADYLQLLDTHAEHLIEIATSAAGRAAQFSICRMASSVPPQLLIGLWLADGGVVAPKPGKLLSLTLGMYVTIGSLNLQSVLIGMCFAQRIFKNGKSSGNTGMDYRLMYSYIVANLRLWCRIVPLTHNSMWLHTHLALLDVAAHLLKKPVGKGLPSSARGDLAPVAVVLNSIGFYSRAFMLICTLADVGLVQYGVHRVPPVVLRMWRAPTDCDRWLYNNTVRFLQVALKPNRTVADLQAFLAIAIREQRALRISREDLITYLEAIRADFNPAPSLFGSGYTELPPRYLAGPHGLLSSTGVERRVLRRGPLPPAVPPGHGSCRYVRPGTAKAKQAAARAAAAAAAAKAGPAAKAGKGKSTSRKK